MKAVRWEQVWGNPFEINSLEELKKMYPDDIDILIEGKNYKYITNEMHFQAAGYSKLLAEISEKEKKEPAHFNRPFFKIIEHELKPSRHCLIHDTYILEVP